MKKLLIFVLIAAMAATLTLGQAVFADDDVILFINRDGILYNGNVSTLFAGHSGGEDEIDVDEYIGGTVEIAGWCVTSLEIEAYGYTLDGGEFIQSDYVNTVEADYNAIRAKMKDYEGAVDAARFWVKVPAMYGDHTIEVYLKTEAGMDLLWTVETYGGEDPNATKAPTPEPTEVPTEAPTEVPTQAPTEVPATQEPTTVPATDKPAEDPAPTENGGVSGETKNNTGLIVGIIIGAVAVVAIIAGIIISKRKK